MSNDNINTFPLSPPLKPIPILNNVSNRFLAISPAVLNGLEPEATIDDFIILEQIGKGSFGKVYKAQHKITNLIYAIKEIAKQNKQNQDGKPYFRREIEIMYKIHHQNVVKLFNHFEDTTKCYFVMEYFSKGNLRTYIKEQNGVEIKTVAKMIQDLISAVYYLHNMTPPIIHRDIKTENILLDDDMRLKLTDFGWSNYINGEFRESICGTPAYFAPEMIKKSGHDEKLDIWCIGILIFELLTKNEPFIGENNENIRNNILNTKINWPKDIDLAAKDLISKILKYEPNERLSLIDILNHRFFKNNLNNPEECLVKPEMNAIKITENAKITVSMKKDKEQYISLQSCTNQNIDQKTIYKPFAPERTINLNNNIPCNSINYNKLYNELKEDYNILQSSYDNLLIKHNKTEQDKTNLLKAKAKLLEEIELHQTQIVDFKAQILEMKQALISKDNEIIFLKKQLDNYLQWKKRDQEEIIRLTNVSHINASMNSNSSSNIIESVKYSADKIKAEYEEYKMKMEAKIEQSNKYYEITVKSLRNETINKGKLLNEKNEELQKVMLQNNALESRKYDNMVETFTNMINKYEKTLQEKEKELETLKLQMRNIEALRQAQINSFH